MKTPVVMELYKASELGRINLDKEVSLKQEWLDSGYGTLYKKGAGYKLTLRQAAKIALTDSDNTAIAAIQNSTVGLLHNDESSVNFLDVTLSHDNNKLLQISSRSYSSFLKCSTSLAI